MTYHFDIREDDALLQDEFGIELSSDEDACIEAKILAVEILKSYSFAADRKAIRVDVRRGEEGPFYTTTLELTGRWSHDPAQADQPVGRLLPRPWAWPAPDSDVIIWNEPETESGNPSSASFSSTE